MLLKRHICDISGTAKGSKWKLTGHDEGDFELNQKKLCISRFQKGASGMTGIKLKFSETAEVDVELNQTLCAFRLLKGLISNISGTADGTKLKLSVPLLLLPKVNNL